MPIFNHGLPIKANVIQGEGGTDTSKDTVTAETLLEGVTAHNAAGEQIVGTCDYNANTESDTVAADKMVQGTTAHDANGAQITGTLDTEAIRADGVEAGEKSAYDAFWDAFQNYGNRNKYEFAFSGSGGDDLGGWTDETFKPKYDIILGEGHTIQRIFWNSRVSDVPSVLEKQGIVFDTTRATWWQQCFQTSKSNRWGVLNASNATYFSYVFSNSSCVTIEKLIVSETVPFANAFDNAALLTNLTIEGTIGQNGFNVSWSPLSKASLTSIINALSDTTTGLTVTLRLSAIKKAFETSEGANNGAESTEWQNLIMSKPNWTINAIDS